MTVGSSMEYARLRSDLAANDTMLADSMAEELLAEANETYTTVRTRNAYARVIFLRRLMMNTAFMTSYVQNSSSESAGDIYKNVAAMLDEWRKALQDARDADAAAPGALTRQSQTHSILLWADW